MSWVQIARNNSAIDTLVNVHALRMLKVYDVITVLQTIGKLLVEKVVNFVNVTQLDQKVNSVTRYVRNFIYNSYVNVCYVQEKSHEELQVLVLCSSRIYALRLLLFNVFYSPMVYFPLKFLLESFRIFTRRVFFIPLYTQRF